MFFKYLNAQKCTLEICLVLLILIEIFPGHDTSTQPSFLSVLKSKATDLFLICPASQNINVIWLNETNTYTQLAEPFPISSSANILALSNTNYPLDGQLNHVSCGYFSSGLYFRTKIWEIRYIESPAISFKITPDNRYVKFAHVNESTALVAISPLSLPLHTLDLLRIECTTNFDYPSEPKVTKLYITNAFSGMTDVWIYTNSESNGVGPFSNPATTYSQQFTKFSSLFTETVSLSDIIVSNYNTTINRLIFECDLLDDKAQPPTVIVSSNNLTLSIGKSKGQSVKHQKNGPIFIYLFIYLCFCLC